MPNDMLKRPFCGGPADKFSEPKQPEITTMDWLHWVECDDCGARGPVHVSVPTDFVAAVDGWNRRA